MLKLLKATALAASVAFSGSVAMAQVNLTSQTAGAGTPVALTATALVEYAAERGIANIQLKDGQVGTKFVMLLAEGKIDHATAPFVLPFVLSKAAGPFSSIDKKKGAELASNIRLLYPYTLSIFTLYSYDAKGVKGWSDLKNRKVLNGPPKGSMAVNSRGLIQIFGGLKAEKDYESVTISFNQMATAMIEGTADAAVVGTNFPGPRVTQASAAGAMTMHSMPKEIFESEAAQRFLNKPGSSPYIVPISQIKAAMGDNWTISSEDEFFRGKAIPGGDMVNKSMDEELAYQLTKAHIENLDRHKKIAPFMASLNFGVLDKAIAGLCGPNPIKFHPGAVRAWEEAGHTVPECAKP